MEKSVDTPFGATVRGPAKADADALAPQIWFDLILRRAGLSFRSARLPDVLSIVREQATARGFASEAAYYQLLSRPADSGADWDVLIERLLNHETSFFRHPPSFEALRTRILPELCDARARTRGGRLNLWSAGCYTGQEAYSLAMLAMADDALRGEFTVWGGDISRHAIDIARRGRYSPRAVATVPAHYRERFLRDVGADPAPAFEIADELRQRVRFMTTNLVGSDGFSANHDVIFCHNVLIYFSPTAVEQATLILKQAKDQQLGARIITTGGSNSPDQLIQQAGDAANGSMHLVFFTPWFPEAVKNPDVANKFVAAWNEKKYPVGGLTEGFRGWDGIHVIVEGIKAAGKADSEAITTALWGVKVKGINGDIAFIKQGPAGKESAQNVPSVYLVRIDGGKVVKQ